MEHTEHVMQGWDIVDPWPHGKSERVALLALQQLGQSTAAAAPQQVRLCWQLYHDIKQRGVTVGSCLHNDSPAGWTLAAALQHMEAKDIYNSLFADTIMHALSKVLPGYTPRYFNNPPDLDSDPESETGAG